MSIASPTPSEVSGLIAKCERAEEGQWGLISTAAELVGREEEVLRFADVDAFMDAAIALLPEGAVWRKYIDNGFSVYGASPYNAQAQERFDGNSPHDALALTAAFLRMRFAGLLAAKAVSQ